MNLSNRCFSVSSPNCRADVAQIDNASAAAPLAPPTPTPPVKRPKDRLRISSLLIVLFAAAFYIVRDDVFRFQTYRLVDGNRVSVRTSAAGIIQKVYVVEGNLARTGDLLLTVENIKLEHRLEPTRDGFHLAEAQLDAHIAKLRRIARQREWDVLDNAAEFFELASELPKRRFEVEEFEPVQFALQGKQGLLSKLAETVSVNCKSETT